MDHKVDLGHLSHLCIAESCPTTTCTVHSQRCLRTAIVFTFSTEEATCLHMKLAHTPLTTQFHDPRGAPVYRFNRWSIIK